MSATATAPKTARPKKASSNPNLKPGARPVRVQSTPVYAFKDLDGPAREKALDWLRQCVAEDQFSLEGWQETVQMDLEALGFTLGTMRHGKRPAIYWSLSYSQGDGVAFEGSADLAALLEKATAAAVAKHAPMGDLPALPADLETSILALMALGDSSTTATLSVENPGRYFSPDATLSVDRDGLDDGGPLDGAADALEAQVSEGLSEWVRNLCAAFEASGYKEREYQEGDEALSESMEANAYTFTADGKRVA